MKSHAIPSGKPLISQHMTMLLAIANHLSPQVWFLDQPSVSQFQQMREAKTAKKQKMLGNGENFKSTCNLKMSKLKGT